MEGLHDEVGFGNFYLFFFLRVWWWFLCWKPYPEKDSLLYLFSSTACCLERPSLLLTYVAFEYSYAFEYAELVALNCCFEMPMMKSFFWGLGFSCPCCLLFFLFFWLMLPWIFVCSPWMFMAYDEEFLRPSLYCCLEMLLLLVLNVFFIAQWWALPLRALMLGLNGFGQVSVLGKFSVWQGKQVCTLVWLIAGSSLTVGLVFDRWGFRLDEVLRLSRCYA